MSPLPCCLLDPDHCIILEPRFVKFPTHDPADDDHLSEFRILYSIPPDHELIFPDRHEWAITCLLGASQCMKSIWNQGFYFSCLLSSLIFSISGTWLWHRSSLYFLEPLIRSWLYVGFLAFLLVPLFSGAIIRFVLLKLIRDGLLVQPNQACAYSPNAPLSNLGRVGSSLFVLPTFCLGVPGLPVGP